MMHSILIGISGGLIGVGAISLIIILHGLYKIYYKESK